MAVVHTPNQRVPHCPVPAWMHALFTVWDWAAYGRSLELIGQQSCGLPTAWFPLLLSVSAGDASVC
jgi:hypothetical protein